KDPGETFFRADNKAGFDFYSGFIHMQDLSPLIKKIEIGDYAVSLGQGLILHNGFGSGKSALVMNIKKDGQSLRPYSSVNETNFFRGGGITLTPSRNTSITAFYSRKSIDGTISIDTLEDSGFESFSSI